MDIKYFKYIILLLLITQELFAQSAENRLFIIIFLNSGLQIISIIIIMLIFSFYMKFSFKKYFIIYIGSIIGAILSFFCFVVGFLTSKYFSFFISFSFDDITISLIWWMLFLIFSLLGATIGYFIKKIME